MEWILNRKRKGVAKIEISMDGSVDIFAELVHISKLKRVLVVWG